MSESSSGSPRFAARHSFRALHASACSFRRTSRILCSLPKRQQNKTGITGANANDTLESSQLRERVKTLYRTESAPCSASYTTQCPQLRTYVDWDRNDWAAPYTNFEDEDEGYWLPVEGVLPAEITGTYFRNGPGTFTVGGDEVAHPFDGDGVVCSISMQDGKAFFRARHVETRERAIEQREGRRVFRSTFGTPAGRHWQHNLLNPVPKNVANTNVIEWGKRCWALFESGQPYLLDPSTLATKGLDTADGMFRPNLPFHTNIPWLDSIADLVLRALHPTATSLHPGPLLGGDAVSSHPKIDPVKQRLVTMQYRLAVQLPEARLITEVAFTEVDPAWQSPVPTWHQLPGYSFLHDFFITPNYHGVFLNPLELDLAPLVLGQKSPIHAVSFNRNTPVRVHLLPRPHRPDLRPLTFDLPQPSFIFHHANAFEQKQEGGGAPVVVVDSVHYDELPDFHAFSGPGHNWRDVDADAQPPSRLFRVRLHTATGQVESCQVNDRVMEFPCVNPTRVGLLTRYVYSAASLHPHLNRPQQAVGKMDVETGAAEIWSRGYRYYVGEPAFIPRPASSRTAGAAEAAAAAPAAANPANPAEAAGAAPGASCAAAPGSAAVASAGKAPAEDDGWVLAMCYDADAGRSEVVVLDARDVAAGPVAVMPLRRPIPHGLHGSWVPAYHGPGQ